MVTATITSKGQVTIPKSVRESLHLKTGDRISFSVHGDNEVVITPVTSSVDDVFGMLHRAGVKSVSVEEMNEAIAKRMRKHSR
jgi:antitoxin PrlF